VTTRVIGVIGESEFSDASLQSAAEEVGRLIARAGYLLICGGLTGVMEAACRGARSAGGRTVGILPGTDAREANAFVDISIPTGLGQGRNIIIALASDALIAIGGGFGTLAEIGHALRLGKPLVGLRTWDASRAGRRAPIAVVDTPQAALEEVARALAGLHAR